MVLVGVLGNAAHAGAPVFGVATIGGKVEESAKTTTAGSPESFVCEVAGDHKEVSVDLVLFHVGGTYQYSYCVLDFWEYGKPGALPTKFRAFFPSHLAEDRIFQNGDIVNIFGDYGKRGNISAEFQRRLIARVFESQSYDPIFGIGRDILQTNAAWRDPRAIAGDEIDVQRLVGISKDFRLGFHYVKNKDGYDDHRSSSNRLNRNGASIDKFPNSLHGRWLMVIGSAIIAVTTLHFIALLGQAYKPTWYNIALIPAAFFVGNFFIDHGLNLSWFGLWNSPYG